MKTQGGTRPSRPAQKRGPPRRGAQQQRLRSEAPRAFPPLRLPGPRPRGHAGRVSGCSRRPLSKAPACRRSRRGQRQSHTLPDICRKRSPSKGLRGRSVTFFERVSRNRAVGRSVHPSPVLGASAFIDISCPPTARPPTTCARDSSDLVPLILSGRGWIVGAGARRWRPPRRDAGGYSAGRAQPTAPRGERGRRAPARQTPADSSRRTMDTTSSARCHLDHVRKMKPHANRAAAPIWDCARARNITETRFRSCTFGCPFPEGVVCPWQNPLAAKCLERRSYAGWSHEDALPFHVTSFKGLVLGRF